MNTGDKLIGSQASYFPLLKRTSSMAVFNRVQTLVLGWAICCSDQIHCLNAPLPPGDPLTFLLSSYQGDRGCPRQKVGVYFPIGHPMRKVVKRTCRLPSFPEIWGLLPTTWVNFFARAWRQFCFAEIALPEILLKGIQNPLCLWTSKLLPKYRSNTCRHLN